MPTATASWSDLLLRFEKTIFSLRALPWIARIERFIWMATLLALDPDASDRSIASSVTDHLLGTKNVRVVVICFAFSA